MSDNELATNMKLSSQINEAADVTRFLDETYNINVKGITELEAQKIRLGWCRIGVDKTDDKIVPIINGGPKTKALYMHIKLWIRQCRIYGNSSLIFNGNGDVRVNNPLTSSAFMKDYGKSSYIEQEGFITSGNSLYFVGEKEEVLKTDSTVFSMFNRADINHQAGQSVVLRSARMNTAAASRNMLRMEQIAQAGAVKKYLLNGIDEDMAIAYSSKDFNSALTNSGVLRDIQEHYLGLGDILTIPANNRGEKATLETMDAQDPSKYHAMQSMFLGNTASTFYLNPRDFAENVALPESYEAMRFEKADLALTIDTFERYIQKPIEDALSFYAEKYGEETPSLTWMPSLAPSTSVMADAFSKIRGKSTNIDYIKWAAKLAGFDESVVDLLAGGALDASA